MDIINWLLTNYQMILSALVAVISAVMAIAMIVPGPQPEKFLESLLEWINKLSLGRSGLD